MRPFAAALPLLWFVLPCMAAETLGKPLALPSPIPLASIESAPAKYVGKTVQVKGKVTEVCQMAGCWMALQDPASGKSLRIKVEDGVIVFPKDAVGRMAIGEGKLSKIEMTREQAVAEAKHKAEEQKREFHPERIKSGITTYQIQGTGAVLLD